jgi:ribosomal protein L12E/L44/L45/RPP1/RPP2
VNNDRLHYRIRDGVRHLAEKLRGKKISEGIEKAKKRAVSAEEAGFRKTKKQKEVYMVNPKKFASEASEEEMTQAFSEADLGTEDSHRILQCKIK